MLHDPQYRQLVEQYAQLSLAVDRYTARGQRPPPQLLDQMRHLETAAQATMNPAELAATDKAVAFAKTHYTGNLNRAQHARQQNEFNATLTRGLDRLTGLTPEQYKEAREHGQVTTKANNDGQAHSKLFEAIAADAGKTLKQFEEELDHLVETRHDPDRQADLAAQYKIPIEMAPLWEKTALQHAMLTREAQRQRDDGYENYIPDETEEVSDELDRRLDLINATADHNDHPFDTEIREEWLNDEGMRGDLSRAWQANDDYNEFHGGER